MLILLITVATLITLFWLLHSPDDMNFRGRETDIAYAARENRTRPAHRPTRVGAALRVTRTSPMPRLLGATRPAGMCA
ncbi:hypothetical protein [Gordonia polyisoprenivorans]|uniref:hypothetical protein n=1 Tax=Gordonia polyisoprenivorans TaxID=84595 RepID=UPI001AD73D4C|nr:hypothetical protein [Gordonia polyisoprenivorans]QTI66758.1 hypothetical protein J6U32_13790 [Gordonia polyisoprenivorans]